MTDEAPGLLSDQQLDELAFHLPHIKAWTKAIEGEIIKALENGATFKNAELVPSLGNRKWCDKDPDGRPFDVLGYLRKFSKLDIVAPRVPLSPTQAEKILGRDVYAKCSEFVVRPSGGMKLTYMHPELTEKD